MKSSYDPDVDALFVRFTDRAIFESEEVSPDLIIDYDANGRIVGIEVLNATEGLAEGFFIPGVAA